MKSQSLGHLVESLSPGKPAPTSSDGEERRSSLRISLPFPATVRGTDAAGEVFEEETVLENFSPCGLYLEISRLVNPGVRLFVLVRLSVATRRAIPAPCIAVHGTVLRVDSRGEARYGTSIEFRRYRFIYTDMD